MFLYNNIRKYKYINQFGVKYLAFYGIIDNRDVSPYNLCNVIKDTSCCKINAFKTWCIWIYAAYTVYVLSV